MGKVFGEKKRFQPKTPPTYFLTKTQKKKVKEETEKKKNPRIKFAPILKKKLLKGKIKGRPKQKLIKNTIFWFLRIFFVFAPLECLYWEKKKNFYFPALGGGGKKKILRGNFYFPFIFFFIFWVLMEY